MKLNNDSMSTQVTSTGSVYTLSVANIGRFASDANSIRRSGTDDLFSDPDAEQSSRTILQALTLGSSRTDCERLLGEHNIDNVAFAHWLAIPSIDCLLVFKQQRCVAIERYSL